MWFTYLHMIISIFSLLNHKLIQDDTQRMYSILVYYRMKPCQITIVCSDVYHDLIYETIIHTVHNIDVLISLLNLRLGQLVVS